MEQGRECRIVRKLEGQDRRSRSGRRSWEWAMPNMCQMGLLNLTLSAVLSAYVGCARTLRTRAHQSATLDAEFFLIHSRRLGMSRRKYRRGCTNIPFPLFFPADRISPFPSRTFYNATDIHLPRLLTAFCGLCIGRVQMASILSPLLNLYSRSQRIKPAPINTRMLCRLASGSGTIAY